MVWFAKRQGLVTKSRHKRCSALRGCEASLRGSGHAWKSCSSWLELEIQAVQSLLHPADSQMSLFEWCWLGASKKFESECNNTAHSLFQFFHPLKPETVECCSVLLIFGVPCVKVVFNSTASLWFECNEVQMRACILVLAAGQVSILSLN